MDTLSNNKHSSQVNSKQESTMQLEVEIALNFLLSFLYNKLPRRRVNQFGEELEKAIKIKFQDHWYADQPSKGSAYRCLKTTSPIDPILEWACLEAGIQLTDIKDNLPDELSIWIDPGEVSYRLSERSPIKIIYSIRQNTQLQPIINCHDNNSQQDSLDSNEPLESMESFTTNFNNSISNKLEDTTSSAPYPSDLISDDFNFQKYNADTSNISQHDNFILDLNQELKQHDQNPLISSHLQQLHAQSCKYTIAGQHHENHLSGSTANYKNSSNSHLIDHSTNDFVLTLGEKSHPTNTDIGVKQFKMPLPFQTSWSSGSSLAASSNGSAVGPVTSNMIQNNNIINSTSTNSLMDQICLDHSAGAKTDVSLNRIMMSANNIDYPNIQQQRINGKSMDSNFCLSQNQISAERQHNNIKFPTTINDYSLLSGNVGQSMNDQNSMMSLRSPTNHSIVALSPLKGHVNATPSIPHQLQQHQQSRINSRNNSFSSSNSLGGSSSSGSMVSATSSASSKSARCHPSFVSGFCGPSQQTILSSSIDPPVTSNTKAQPLVFTAAMFAQTKFGSTKLKNQNNHHNHHGALNSSAGFSTQQQSILRLSSHNQQNSILPSSQLPINSGPTQFGSSLVRSPSNHLPNQQSTTTHNHQQILNRFNQQGSSICATTSNKYTLGHTGTSSLLAKQQQQSFLRSSDFNIKPTNLFVKSYDTIKNNTDHDEVAGDNQAAFFRTNELISVHQGHQDSMNNSIPSLKKPLDAMIDYEAHQNKESTMVGSLNDDTFNSIISEPSIFGLVPDIPEDRDFIVRNGENSEVKEETMRQLESIFNLPETNCRLSAPKDDEVTTKRDDYLDIKVYGNINTQQEMRRSNKDPHHLNSSSDRLFDSDYTSLYELWSSRTSPLTEYSNIVEKMGQDRKVDFVARDIELSNEEGKPEMPKMSNLFSEELSQNPCLEPSSEEAIYFPSFYQAFKKHDQDNNQEELRDILMRLMFQQPDKNLTEISSSNMNIDVAIGPNEETDILDSNKQTIDRNYQEEKPGTFNTIDNQVQTSLNDLCDKVLRKESNNWFGSSGKEREPLNESTNETFTPNEKNESACSSLSVDSKNDCRFEELPMVELNEKINSLLLEEGQPNESNDSKAEFVCAKVSTINSTMTPTDNESESIMKNHDQTQMIMSSSVVDSGIVSINSSASSNYNSTSNQQCKHQTQQRTQQLLLAN